MNWCLDIELGFLDINWGEVFVVKIKLIHAWYVVYESIMWREGGVESGKTRLLTFSEILGRRMRELGSGSFIEIIDFDVS